PLSFARGCGAPKGDRQPATRRIRSCDAWQSLPRRVAKAYATQGESGRDASWPCMARAVKK
ncbi:MAG: hypothetical protein IJ684_01340, partial [Bacteroidales bacterium]|nr:hypothetical protein [Bacteroidales bacterium]